MEGVAFGFEYPKSKSSISNKVDLYFALYVKLRKWRI